MVYAVSDVARRGAHSRSSRAVRTRAANQAISIHWPRVIALGLNTLVWVGIIVGAWSFFRH
jgi:hypothetical protein